MQTKAYLRLIAVMLVVGIGLTIGCTKPPSDAQVTSDIQSKFNSDSGLQGKQLAVDAANGTVTLSGAVDNEAQRKAAAKYAASIPGVKQVVNNLTLSQAAMTTPAPAPTASEETPAPAPVQKPRPSAPRRHVSSSPKSNDTTSSSSGSTSS